MKLPNKINTLHLLSKWVIKNKPKVIEIGEDSKLLEIEHFGTKFFQFYRGIPVKYLGSIRN